MARQKKHRKNPLRNHQQQQQLVHVPQPPRANFIAQASPLLRLSPEVRNQIYEQVLVCTPDLTIKFFNLCRHTIQQHLLSQTCRQIRFEFAPLHNHSAARYAKTIHFNIQNFSCSGLDATFKRLALDPDHPLPNFEIRMHLDNNVSNHPGRKSLHHLIQTGGLFSQASQVHTETEHIDLISSATKIIFAWEVLSFNLETATEALDVWCCELLATGKMLNGSVEAFRAEKIWKAFNLAAKETEIWRGELNEELEGAVESTLLSEGDLMLWVRWWLWRRVSRGKVMLGVASVLVALVAWWFLRG